MLRRLGSFIVIYDEHYFFFPQLSPPPQYIDERLDLYKTLKAEHDALMAERAANSSGPIKVTLPDGKVVDAFSWKTTPYEVASGIRWVTPQKGRRQNVKVFCCNRRRSSFSNK